MIHIVYHKMLVPRAISSDSCQSLLTTSSMDQLRLSSQENQTRLIQTESYSTRSNSRFIQHLSDLLSKAQSSFPPDQLSMTLNENKCVYCLPLIFLRKEYAGLSSKEPYETHQLVFTNALTDQNRQMVLIQLIQSYSLSLNPFLLERPFPVLMSHPSRPSSIWRSLVLGGKPACRIWA